MSALGAVDPANLRAQARAELGLSRQLAQSWRVAPHPRGGGSSDYPVWSREEQLEKWGEETVASEASLYRWSKCLIPHRCTGNRARTQIVGTDLINLVVLLFTHPNANINEMAAHIYNEGGGMYSSQQISKRLKELAITKKIASVEAYQAQTEAVQHRVFSIWNRAPPLGIFQVPRRMLIDVDKFGVTIERCKRKKGWALKLFRVRKDGHYGHGQKLTVLFAIEPGDPALPANVYGSVEHPRRWIRYVRNIGTSNNTFQYFCEYVCSDIEVNSIADTDDNRVFIWDNLAVHHSSHVRVLVVSILSRGRRCENV
jgi:hypothetical protein